MIVDFSRFVVPERHDLCVVGAGPIGIALALAAAGQGMKVVLLESGGETPEPAAIELGRGAIRRPHAHTQLTEANCRALGGTSHWWGGRCVPFDPIDFADRPWLDGPGWPIGYDDVAPFYEEAAAFAGCGPADFSIEGPWRDLRGLAFDTLERWAVNPNLGAVHRETLSRSEDVTVVLGATVTDLMLADDRRSVAGVVAAGDGKRLELPAPRVALACGGVQTPRLLLAVQAREPALFGGPEGPLGRFYMGHVFGKIADLVLADRRRGRDLDFFKDRGAYVRRRFTLPDEVQSDQGLLQTTFTAGNARVSDPSHRSGPLSLIWLMLASPLGKRLLPDALLQIYIGTGARPYGAHIGNVVRNIFPTILSALQIFRERYLSKPGKPAVFLASAGGRYTVHYHSEQSPDPENRLRLSDEVDAVGMARLDIDFGYARADAERIVRAHGAFDAALQANGVGRLEYQADEAGRIASVLEQARDGMHQIGATRMAADPGLGVVDRDCRVHGLSNLFIAATSVFPTSSQANPTFLGVALAHRLAAHLAASRA